MDGALVHPVAEHVVDRAVRPVDRQLREVRAAEPGHLGVEVGEQAGLHQRVVGGFDTWHQVAGVERDLLGLGEVVGRVAVERHLPDQLDRRQLLGHQLGRVEQIDAFEAVACRRRASPGCRAPIRGRRPPRCRRPCRGGGSPGRRRRRSAPLPTPRSGRRRPASSGT